MCVGRGGGGAPSFIAENCKCTTRAKIREFYNYASMHPFFLEHLDLSTVQYPK